MSARRMVVCRLFVLGCALFLMAFAAEPAMAGPQPEAPPQPHSGSAHVQPIPAPSASGTNSSASTQVTSSTSTRVSSPTSTTPPLSTSVRTVPQSPVTAAHVRASSRPLHTGPRRHATPRQAPRHQPPSLNSGWPTWLRGTTGSRAALGREGGRLLPACCGRHRARAARDRGGVVPRARRLAPRPPGCSPAGPEAARRRAARYSPGSAATLSRPLTVASRRASSRRYSSRCALPNGATSTVAETVRPRIGFRRDRPQSCDARRA